jgi:hypothetical protein
MQPKLDIYIDHGCQGCERAIRIAQLVQENLPEVTVNLFELSKLDGSLPEFIFAVPTYVLNGKTFSLGNPDETVLLAQLHTELNRAS